jgi:hypothetical protein
MDNFFCYVLFLVLTVQIYAANLRKYKVLLEFSCNLMEPLTSPPKSIEANLVGLKGRAPAL